MDFKTCFTKTNVYFGLFILLSVFAIIKMIDIALLVFCCYVIFAAINPMVDKLSQKMPRSIASGIMVTILGVAIILVLTPIVVLAVHEVRDFATQLPTQIHQIQSFLHTAKIGGQNIGDMIDFNSTFVPNAQMTNNIIQKSINATIGFLGVITILVTMGIIIFFMTDDRTEIKEFSLKLFPESIKDKASEVIDSLETKVGGYVTAQLLSMVIIGIIVAIGLAILHVKYAILLGFIAAISDLIPVIGPIISGLLIFLSGFQNGLIIACVSVFVLIIAQFIQNNWAKPYLFSKYMDLHPLVVIFSFIIAAKLLGVIGVIIAPALAAVVVTLFDEIYVKNMNDESN